MKKNTVLVTGGAGYIGSHVVKHLLENHEQVVALDNLSTGFKDLLLGGEFVEGDIGDDHWVNGIFEKYKIEAVIHLAASIDVAE